MLKRRKSFPFLVLVVLVSTPVVALLSRSREPRWNHQPLSYWVKAAGSSERNTDPHPIEAIQAIGTNALPCLLDWINYEGKPSRLKESVRSVLVALPPRLSFRSLN